MARKASSSTVTTVGKFQSTATTAFVTVALGELKIIQEKYRHRDDEEAKSGLKELADSILTEGQLTPIEFFVDDRGVKVLICGHRRVLAMKLLVGRNEPGWTEQTLVKAQESKGSPEDHVIRSIADNVNRRSLSDRGILSAVRVAIAAKAQHTRIAVALGIPLTTFERYAALARNDQMRTHVENSDIGFSDAIKLLQAAEKANRVDQFLSEFKSIVAILGGKIAKKNWLMSGRWWRTSPRGVPRGTQAWPS
jgi:ParB/Sulfiredoxin domain